MIDDNEPRLGADVTDETDLCLCAGFWSSVGSEVSCVSFVSFVEVAAVGSADAGTGGAFGSGAAGAATALSGTGEESPLAEDVKSRRICPINVGPPKTL